ncbi:MAG: thioredoxin family protein, partial [Aequorivita vladivostokensis]|nr:thioredoxin family protein [Aequorivita vladivostokensis]
MKKLFIILSATFLVACNSSKEKNKLDENTSKEMISENNKEKINDTVPYEDTVILLGKANRKGFQMDAFKSWFNTGYENYKVDSETLEKLKPLLKDATITVFMGTWCEDSQRETPHFYKILDEANFDESKLTLITVSDEKTTPQGFEDGKNITNVPTLIFYKNGKELGRIVEY